METFKVTKISSDKNGESFFEEVFYPLTESGPIGFLSEKLDVKSLMFRKVIPHYDYDFHTAPQKQFIVLLDGEIEIETSLGDVRSFKSGEVLQVEDISGKGHKTRNLKQEVRNSLFIVY